MITRKTVKDVVKEGDDGAQFPTSQYCTPSSDSMTVASSLSRFLLCAGMYSGMCTLGLQWGFILIRLSDTVICKDGRFDDLVISYFNINLPPPRTLGLD